MFYEKTASVARLSQDSGDSNKEQYATIQVYNNIQINIQPASAEVVALVDGAYGQVYTGFTTASGIQIGDRITVSGVNDIYIVKGVNDWNYAPIAHVELVLTKGDK